MLSKEILIDKICSFDVSGSSKLNKRINGNLNAEKFLLNEMGIAQNRDSINMLYLGQKCPFKAQRI